VSLTEPEARDWDPPADAEATAYVMYTSGSTGQPKGVMVTHRAIVRLAINNGYADFRPTDRVAFASNPAFDASTMEVWATRLNGGSVVVVDQAILLDPQRFKRWLEDHAISILWLTVGLFHQYAEALAGPFARLRTLITGGDIVDARVAARVLERSPPQRLLNGYGPTETTTFAATYQICEVAASATRIPIGRPISNTRIYILDRHREPVPIGASGEIHIGGAGVARGYLNRPELTAERFIASPFVGGDRLYRTGDLGRYRPDGTIEYLGRNDFQVKIRGFRIELGEIEARLAEHPGVREAVALAREDAPGDQRLVAYTIARPDAAAAETEELRAYLAAGLPEYMVPAAYVRLDVLPLTANGKLDRQALPAPEMSDFAVHGYEQPRGETEERLARIWADLLGFERVGRRDNFFDLGGHSLLAIRLLSKIRASFKTNLPLSTVFHSPTIAAVARLLKSQGAPSEWFSLIPIQQGGSRPPLFGVEIVGVEFYRLIGADQPVYNFRFGAGSPAGTILELPMIEALAAHYIEELRTVQPNGPYFLIGYSWGGLVAYEIAQQLTANGEVVELVALVDTLLPISYRQSFGDRAVRIISYPPSKLFQRLKYKLRTKLNKESVKYNMTLTFRKWIHGATYYRPDSFRC
jgi:amino acid adenylation domain-containing protein